VTSAGVVAFALAVGLVVGAVGAHLASLRAERRRAGRLRLEASAAERRAAAAEAGARAAEARLAAVERGVSEGLVYLTPDLKVDGASPSARVWFELDPAGRPSLLAAIRSVELAEAVRIALAEGTQLGAFRLGGRTYRMRVEPAAEGGAVLAIRDDTDRERLARARRDLVANVSHDLRTPLTAIGLVVEALAGGALADPALGPQLVATLGEQLVTLRALADGLVDLDRLESGQAHFRLQPVTVRSLARAALASIAPQFDQRDVRLATDLPARLRVLADPPHVGRVLTNLLDNALRYSPAGGTVRLAATPAPDGSPEPDRVEISVTDEGPGIAPSDLDRVFERFYRADRSRTGKGAGLGLAIARHIVEGHGGRIVADHAPGGGALLRFTLPAAEAPARVDQPNRPVM